MYILNIDSNTQRVLSVYLSNNLSQENNILIEDLPEYDVTDYIWNGESLIYSPRDKIEDIPVESEESHIWKVMADAIREGVNAL